jgi:glycine dehydrogenase subunit 1
MVDIIHPYIPNSAPDSRRVMLDAIGVGDVDELYREVPARLRLDRPLDLPDPLVSEYELKRHVGDLLRRNTSVEDYLSFLGAGAEQHHVPAVVDAMISRGEFLTAYNGLAYTDKGRMQVMFEYQSMLCDLLGMEIAGFPMTCGLQASSTALRMASRITKRAEVLVPASMNPRRLAHLRTYCRHSEVATITQVDFDPAIGLMDLDDLASKLHAGVAAVLVENPSYLGVIESQCARIAELAHSAGALLVASVNPISLGVLASPGDYGADIACGDSQPLGVHLNYGGGTTGFVATKDIAEHIAEFPNLIVSIVSTRDGTDFGFTKFAYPERLHYMARELGKEYTGTNTGLWAIANAVFLALLGPQGMADLGEVIAKKSHFAKGLISQLPGVSVPLSGAHFNEFVVNFDGTGHSVAQVNDALLDRGIFGGLDLSGDFPSLDQSALYCVSEVHSASDLKRLARELEEVTR